MAFRSGLPQCLAVAVSGLLLAQAEAMSMRQSQSSSPPNSGGSIYVIDLHGSVGTIPGVGGLKPLTAKFLHNELQKAKAAKASAVVLDIDGPGGLVSEMEMMVDEILQAQVNDRLRVVAFVNNAYSAWAIIALSCKEIVVRPLSRMGAAVRIRQDANGFVEAVEGQGAVDQKLAAPWHTIQRQVRDFTGRSGCVDDAMSEQKKELWWSPTQGLAAKRGPESDWEQLDDSVGVCCLSGSEMIKTGLAVAQSIDLGGIPAVLQLPGASLVGGTAAPQGVASTTSPAAPNIARSAAKRVRTALSHLAQLDLGRATTTRLKTEQFSNPAVVGGVGTREVQVRVSETDSERSARIQHALRGIRNALPAEKDCGGDQSLRSDVAEIKILLLEAIDHARADAWLAAKDRVSAALTLMKAISDRF